jgi:uncharacterized HAD superfamily protein
MAKKRPKLCVDIDNVIARTDEVIRGLILNSTGGRVRLRYEDVKEFNYYECQDADGNCITKEEWDSIHQMFATPDVLWTVAPDPKAIIALRQLISILEIHVVTSRLPKGQDATLEWLKRHRVPYDIVNFVGHRQKHASTEAFFAAIEDDYGQAVEFAKIRVPCLLIRHPWNATKAPIHHVEWVAEWQEAVAILRSKLTP